MKNIKYLLFVKKDTLYKGKAEKKGQVKIYDDQSLVSFKKAILIKKGAAHQLQGAKAAAEKYLKSLKKGQSADIDEMLAAVSEDAEKQTVDA